MHLLDTANHAIVMDDAGAASLPLKAALRHSVRRSASFCVRCMRAVGRTCRETGIGKVGCVSYIRAGLFENECLATLVRRDEIESKDEVRGPAGCQINFVQVMRHAIRNTAYGRARWVTASDSVQISKPLYENSMVVTKYKILVTTTPS